VTSSDDPRKGFMPPWPDWQARTPDELADRLRNDTFAVEPDTPEARAAIGLAIAVGNYEWLLDKPSRVIMDAAAERLEALGRDRSKYWG
jgi:hypothetical protein